MKLRDLATVIRSKNASPFITTLDLFFKDGDNYRAVKDSGIFTAELIARLYKLPISHVLGLWFVDDCQGIKISILKHVSSDQHQSTDLYGAQQSMPLLELEFS